MNMAYSNNPNLPKVRMDAVKMLLEGHSTRQVARHFGYSQSTIVKWHKRADLNGYWKKTVPTRSCRPRSHPKELQPEVIRRIIEYRLRTGRGAEFIHFMLSKDGVYVSLSSVKRTLSRNGMTKYSKWKKWHQYPPRPLPQKPGLLVQEDTVHVGDPGRRLYVYTLLDVHSRWAYAAAVVRIGAQPSVDFTGRAHRAAPFVFSTVQTDHGPEFGTWFTKKLAEQSIDHRHSRVRTPTDNGHLERFNRTIQEECINRVPRDLKVWQKEIPAYIHYYNTERPHMGIGMKTPSEMLTK